MNHKFLSARLQVENNYVSLLEATGLVRWLSPLAPALSGFPYYSSSLTPSLTDSLLLPVLDVSPSFPLITSLHHA